MKITAVEVEAYRIPIAWRTDPVVAAVARVRTDEGLEGLGPAIPFSALHVRSPHLMAGYYFYDEPGAGWFATLAKALAISRELAPQLLPYINLFPSDDAAYYRNFVDVVKPSVIVHLGGGEHMVRSVRVSAYPQPGQADSRFAGLRRFQILTCDTNNPSTPTCLPPTDYTSVYTSPANTNAGCNTSWLCTASATAATPS